MARLFDKLGSPTDDALASPGQDENDNESISETETK
jgi:hypothetical protein